VRFFDSPTGGNALGAAISGNTTVGDSGRFSIEILPPTEILGAADVYYDLGVDSANLPDGSVDPADIFPERVHVTSVPFAHTLVIQGSGSGLDADLLDGLDSSDLMGGLHSHNLQDLPGAVTDAQVPDDITIDHAATSDLAMGLSGSLSNPGDQIPLGNDVFLQVGPDGEVEFLAGGRRLRLAGQEWFYPRGFSDNISPDGSPTSNYRVAINSKGEALIVWVQFDGMRDQIFCSQYLNGIWRDPKNLLDNISADTHIASDPVVAISDNSDAVILWFQSDGAKQRILRTDFRNGQWINFGGAFVSPPGQDAFAPQIAMNAVGETVIVWNQSDGSNTQIFRSEYRNGAWTDPTSLTDNISPDGQGASNPRVAINNNGLATIVWEQSDGLNNQVFRSEYEGGAWADPTSLADNISPNGQDVIGPKVVLNDNGEGVIVWAQSDSNSMQVFRSERRGAAWSDPTDINDNISPDGQPVMEPQIALSEGGDAVIVWAQPDGSNSQIFRSEYRNGTWTDPADLSDSISPNGTLAQTPQVRMSNNGEAVILWDQSDGANLQLFRSEYRNGAWIESATLTDNFSPDSFPVFDSQLDMNAGGETVIVWRQSDSSFQQVFRSEYRNGAWTDPTSLSDNISPNGSNADSPLVGLGDNSDTVIVWRQIAGAINQIFRSEFRFGF
jgi:hypothetical protein